MNLFGLFKHKKHISEIDKFEALIKSLDYESLSPQKKIMIDYDFNKQVWVMRFYNPTHYQKPIKNSILSIAVDMFVNSYGN